jgi:putative ABC transport system permease protein
MATVFPENYPEIESVVRMLDWGYRTVRHPDSDEEYGEKMAWADSTFFKVFSVQLLEGHGLTALKEPNAIAINSTMAKKYFPGGNAMGQSLVVDNQNYRVTGVYEDLPENSHFHFGMLRSMTGLEDAKSVSFIGGAQLQVYLLLREGTDASQLEAKFPDFVNTYVAPQIGGVISDDFSMEKFIAEGNIWEYTLTPLTDIHLHSNLEAEFEPNGSITYVYLFSSIAIFILVIACINFMNLSTARSADRAREVGIRKVMGSLRSHLIRQFLTESFLLSLAAFLLALGLAHLFLPVFNSLAQKNLSLPLGDSTFYFVLLGAVGLVGVMAGLYPAFFLSGFKPVSVLKGKIAMGSQSGFIRNGLVVFQFVISIFLIIATITIQRQLGYVQNKRLGFNKDQVVVIHQAQHLGSQIQAFKGEVLRNSFIPAGTISSYLPVDGTWRNFNTFWPEGKAPTGEDVNEMIGLQIWAVDHDYINTLGIRLKTGRNFIPGQSTDSTQSVILNEAAVSKFEMGDNPIGKKISMFGGTNPDGTPDINNIRTWEVIGVIEDFHFSSLRENIQPLGLFFERSDGFVSFRFAGNETQDVLKAISATWEKMVPGRPFEYSFLDDDFGKMYKSEQRLGTIFAIFAGLAIIIACLGLFALTSFTAQRRTKEIGIRKILGASIESIVLLLSKTYSKLILIAFLLSAPAAWYAVNWWLESYAYKADVGVMVYILAGATAFIIAMLTIGYQSIRAARANPANSLRSE